MPPELAPWHLMTAKEYNFIRLHLDGNGMAPKTIHRTLSFVRSTLNCARVKNLIPETHIGEFAMIMAMGNVKGSTGRGEIKPHRSLTDDEIDGLFKSLVSDKTNAGSRDLAILSCMRGCGLRRMDITNLAIEDIRWSAGKYGEICIKKSKGGKTRIVPMPPGLREIIARWLAARGEELGPVFVGIHRSNKLLRVTGSDIIKRRYSGLVEGEFRPLDRSSVNYMMERRLIKAGIEKATPHDLRYTFAQNVCDLLGHSSIMTTSIYTETSRERLRDVVGGDAVFDLLEITKNL
jgi:integrase/recombinase XerD